MVEKVHFEKNSIGCLFQVTNHMKTSVMVDQGKACSQFNGTRDPLGEISNKILMTRISKVNTGLVTSLDRKQKIPKEQRKELIA